MKFTSLHYIWILSFALILQFIVYFGFDSAYFSYKHLPELPNFYQENVYKYRVFSNEVFDGFERWFRELLIRTLGHSKVNELSVSIGTPFYLSLFLYNTFFFAGFILLLFKTLQLQNLKSHSINSKIILIGFLLLLIAISQYVITPYDMTALFFLQMGIILSLKYLNTTNYFYIVLLSILMVISTLNRESSAINLAFFGALLIRNYGLNKKSIAKIFELLLLPTLMFLLTYGYLRVHFGSSEVIQGNYILQNLTKFKNILGLIFFLLMLSLPKVLQKKSQLALVILVLTLPYLMIILIGGILWEVRLFIPVLIPYFLCYLIQLKPRENA